MFDAINDLLEACASGHGRDKISDTATFLADYIATHFRDEEDLQKSVKYPYFDQHHTFHTGYKEQIATALASIEQNGPTMGNLRQINQLANVLIQHIRKEDKRLAAFVRGEL